MAAPAATLASRLGATRAGQAVDTAALARSARPKAPKIRVRAPRSSLQPTVAAMTVVVGLGVLRTIVVEKKSLPDRQFWLNVAIIGFVLSLTGEVAPRIGRPLAYLVLTAAAVSQGDQILSALIQQETKLAADQKKADKKQGKGAEPATGTPPRPKVILAANLGANSGAPTKSTAPTTRA